MVNNRGIPLYFELLDHRGNSDLENQQGILSLVLPGLKNYKTVGSFGIVGKNVRSDTKSLGVGYGADQNLLPSRQNHPRA